MRAMERRQMGRTTEAAEGTVGTGDCGEEDSEDQQGEGGVDPVLNLLLVDDSKLNRRMLARLLCADDGYCCEEAEDGVEAVRRVQAKLPLQYDAILMDFMMPNLDGPGATKEIRRLGYLGLILGVTGESVH